MSERIRTSNRTNNYCNEELTIKVNQRLPEELLEAVEASPPYTSVRGLHPNWRVGRYQPGQTFPAHQDQADFVTVRHQERGRQRFTSSHTLLVNLRQPGKDFQGGATRFFMEGELEPVYYQVSTSPSLRNLQREDGGYLAAPGLGSGLPAEGPLPCGAASGGRAGRQVHRPGWHPPGRAGARGPYGASLGVQVRPGHS